MIQIKSAKEIALMMKATELSQQVLMHAGRSIKPGMTTLDIDLVIREFLERKGAKPSFLGLYGFPGAACISVNEELIHGIPSAKKTIKNGDIVTIDVGAYVNGFHGDNAHTFVVGEVDSETRRLLDVTEKSLYEGIKMAVPGNRVGDISHAVQAYCEDKGFYVVKRYVGHGVGHALHEDPEVPNYGKAGRGPRLVPGMTIAIEPMINQTTEEVNVLDNKWTVVEANNKMCAHFEHTILITDAEPIIMTLESH